MHGVMKKTKIQDCGHTPTAARKSAVRATIQVPLTRYGITAEMTATARVGVHRYTFPASAESAIVFDLENGGCWDKTTKTFMEAVGKSAIRGYRYSEGWANDQKIYFYAELSKPFDSFKLNGKDNMYGRASFSTKDGEQVLLKVAISPVSMEGAKANMEAELQGWDFDAVAKAADKAWNDELSKIKIETADEQAKTVFYTALYHTMVAPSLFCDADSSYRGADGQNHAVRKLRELHHLLALGHLQGRNPPDDHYSSRKDERHGKHHALHLPAARQTTRMAPNGLRNKLYGGQSRHSRCGRRDYQRI